MCVYLGVDKQLPECPWDGKTQRPLYLEQVREEHDILRRRIGRAHVYHMGAFEGCSCKFINVIDPEDEEDYAAIASVNALRDYIREYCMGADPAIFACWEGDESRDVKRTRRIRIDEMSSPGFRFDEGDFVEFIDS